GTTRKIGAVIAQRGAAMIDCPVGKTADAAVAGTLTLMAGGSADVVARCRPVLDCMGTDFFHCGELGSGQTMKLLNNLLATAVSEASIEALVSGVKAGLTLDTMLSVLRTTMAWNNALAIALPKRPVAGDFHSDDDVAVALRDIDAGETVDVRRGGTIRRMLVREAIPLGHKFALSALSGGAAIRKYGECIGVATADIGAGSHVHVHNMASRRA